MPTRYIEKIENIAATISYLFPLKAYEWTSEQSFRTAYAAVAGADYAHDFHGYLSAPKDVARERIRAIAVESSAANLEAEIDEMRSELQRIGLGKAYTLESDGTTRRWAYARPASLPNLMRGVGQTLHMPTGFDMLRFSDWFAAAASTGTQSVTASPTDFTIANNGNIPAKFMVFRLRAGASGGITNPSILNQTNNYSIATTRDSASLNDEIRINTETKTVEYSTDDGVSYADDYALVTLGGTQVGFFLLDPGNNSIRITCGGTPNFSFEWSFFAPFA